MIEQNWSSFGPVEGEEDLVEAPKPKLQETIWFGQQPAPAFKLKLEGEDSLDVA